MRILRRWELSDEDEETWDERTGRRTASSERRLGGSFYNVVIAKWFEKLETLNRPCLTNIPRAGWRVPVSK